MSIRKFIVYAICNPQGLMSIGFRRAPSADQRTGRHLNNGRIWYEGKLSTTLDKIGWCVCRMVEVFVRFVKRKAIQPC